MRVETQSLPRTALHLPSAITKPANCPPCGTALPHALSPAPCHAPKPRPMPRPKAPPYHVPRPQRSPDLSPGAAAGLLRGTPASAGKLEDEANGSSSHGGSAASHHSVQGSCLFNSAATFSSSLGLAVRNYGSKIKENVY